jgi:hypothetical protein
MNGGAIQQATNNSTINYITSNETLGKINDYVRELRLNLQELNLPIEQQEELEAEIETIERQNKSPRPKTEIVSIALKSIASIAIGVASNLSTPFVQGLIHKTQLLIEALQHSQ